MNTLYWAFIIILFVISFIGLVYPIIPSVVFLIGGFFLYGILFSFEELNWLFWLVQGLFVILLFGADFLANIIGIKKYGGTKAGIWGSTVGIIFGPFVIPVLGILIGPFLGAIIAEWLINKKHFKEAVSIGFGSVIGFISSVVAKGFLQVMMIVYFIILIV